MTEQITEQRLNEYLAFSQAEEDDEMVAILTELSERRGQAYYSRQQRLDFMLRFIKDTAPEVAKEIRDIFKEEHNATYYARRDAEYWKSKHDKVKEAVDG